MSFLSCLGHRTATSNGSSSNSSIGNATVEPGSLESYLAQAKAHAREQDQQVAALQALLLKQREAQQEDALTAQATARQAQQYRERCEALLIARTLLQEEVISHLKTIAARDAALERLRCDLADAEYEADQLKVAFRCSAAWGLAVEGSKRLLEERLREIACRAVIAAAAAAASSASAVDSAAVTQVDPVRTVSFPLAAADDEAARPSVPGAGESEARSDNCFNSATAGQLSPDGAGQQADSEGAQASNGGAADSDASAALAAAMATVANRVMQEAGQGQGAQQQHAPQVAQVAAQLQQGPLEEESLLQATGPEMLATLPTLHVDLPPWDLGPPSLASQNEHLHLLEHQPPAAAVQPQGSQPDAVQALWDLAEALRTLLVTSAAGDAQDAAAHGIIPAAAGAGAGEQTTFAAMGEMGAALPPGSSVSTRGAGIGFSIGNVGGLPGQNTTARSVSEREASTGVFIGSPPGLPPTAASASPGARVSREWEPHHGGMAGSAVDTQPSTSGVLPVLQPPDPSRKKSLHALASLQTQYLQALHSSTAPLYGASSSWLMGAMADVAVGRTPSVPGVRTRPRPGKRHLQRHPGRQEESGSQPGPATAATATTHGTSNNAVSPTRLLSPVEPAAGASPATTDLIETEIKLAGGGRASNATELVAAQDDGMQPTGASAPTATDAGQALKPAHVVDNVSDQPLGVETRGDTVPLPAIRNSDAPGIDGGNRQPISAATAAGPTANSTISVKTVHEDDAKSNVTAASSVKPPVGSEQGGDAGSAVTAMVSASGPTQATSAPSVTDVLPNGMTMDQASAATTPMQEARSLSLAQLQHGPGIPAMDLVTSARISPGGTAQLHEQRLATAAAAQPAAATPATPSPHTQPPSTSMAQLAETDSPIKLTPHPSGPGTPTGTPPGLSSPLGSTATTVIDLQRPGALVLRPRSKKAPASARSSAGGATATPAATPGSTSPVATSPTASPNAATGSKVQLPAEGTASEDRSAGAGQPGISAARQADSALDSQDVQASPPSLYWLAAQPASKEDVASSAPKDRPIVALTPLTPTPASAYEDGTAASLHLSPSAPAPVDVAAALGAGAKSPMQGAISITPQPKSKAKGGKAAVTPLQRTPAAVGGGLGLLEELDRLVMSHSTAHTSGGGAAQPTQPRVQHQQLQQGTAAAAAAAAAAASGSQQSSAGGGAPSLPVTPEVVAQLESENRSLQAQVAALRKEAELLKFQLLANEQASLAAAAGSGAATPASNMLLASQVAAQGGLSSNTGGAQLMYLSGAGSAPALHPSLLHMPGTSPLGTSRVGHPPGSQHYRSEGPAGSHLGEALVQHPPLLLYAPGAGGSAAAAMAAANNAALAGGSAAHLPHIPRPPLGPTGHLRTSAGSPWGQGSTPGSSLGMSPSHTPPPVLGRSSPHGSLVGIAPVPAPSQYGPGGPATGASGPLQQLGAGGVSPPGRASPHLSLALPPAALGGTSPRQSGLPSPMPSPIHTPGQIFLPGAGPEVQGRAASGGYIGMEGLSRSSSASQTAAAASASGPLQGSSSAAGGIATPPQQMQGRTTAEAVPGGAGAGGGGQMTVIMGPAGPSTSHSLSPWPRMGGAIAMGASVPPALHTGIMPPYFTEVSGLGISRDALLAWALHQQEEQRAKKEQQEQSRQQQ